MGGPRRLEWLWRGCAPETKATIVTPSSIPIVHAYPEGIAAWLRPVMPHREVIGLANEAAFVEALPNIEVLVAHLPPRKHWPAAERLRLLHAVGAQGGCAGRPRARLLTNGIQLDTMGK